MCTLAWSPHSVHLAVNTGSQVRVFDNPFQFPGYTQLDRIYSGHSGLVRSLSWSPDSKSNLLASASDDRTVQVWSAEPGPFISKSYKNDLYEVLAVAWSPDGKFIAFGGNDRTVQLWYAPQSETTAAGQLYNLYRGHTDTVRAIAWSPNGKHFASGSEDSTVRLWSFDGSAYVYSEHTADINTVTYSPDGKLIASASNDKTVRVWLADVTARHVAS